jgi:Zn-dependent M28 family amino/carboxypeptidase
MGLQTSTQVWLDETNPNVMAEQTGTGLPHSLILLTAHLDDKPDIGPGNPRAPGADDNASGSAGVLIAAEILSQVGCYHTVRYVLFTGEEQGLLGSRAYAESVASQPIEAVLNLDMIGWNSDSDPGIDLYARDWYPDDFRIATLFARVINAYQINLNSEILGERITGSDHASFWDKGFPAILAIEDRDDFNIYYHTSNDRLAYLNLDYLTSFIQAAVGALAHMACLAPPPVYLPIIRGNPASSR